MQFFSSIIADPMVVFGSLEFFHEQKMKKIICIIPLYAYYTFNGICIFIIDNYFYFYRKVIL